MLQLYIDGQPVTLPANATLKLTRENPYFSSAGDYTLEITVPLDGVKQNRLALGALHVPYASRAGLASRRLPMRIVSEAGTYEGQAVVTSVDQSGAKLQLIAGRSAFDHAIEGGDQYIDRMDLGRAWDKFPDRRPFDVLNGHESSDNRCSKDNDPFSHMPLYIRSLWHDNAYGQEAMNMMRGRWPDTDCVLFPIYSENSEKFCNQLMLEDRTAGVWLPYCELVSGVPHITPCAPQPYLLEVVERVIKGAGYVPDLSFFKAESCTHIARRFIIANTRCTPIIAQMLPHWTLREFIENVQNALGVVFVVEGRTVRLLTRQAWYGTNQDPDILKKVVADFSADIETGEDAEQKTTSAGNVGYDFSQADDQLCLPDEVWEYATIKKFLNYSTLREYANQLDDEQRAKSDTLFIDQQRGNAYAFLHDAASPNNYHLRQLDQYGPLIRTDLRERDSITRLAIEPLPMKLSRMGNPLHTGADEIFDKPNAQFPDSLPMLCSKDKAEAGEENYSIDLAVNNTEDVTTKTEDEDNKLSALPLAYWDETTTARREDTPTSDAWNNVPCAIGLTLIEHATNGSRIRHPHLQLSSALPEEGPFRLKRTSGKTEYIGTLYQGTVSIDTRIEHEFQFLDSVTDPQRPFIIRGHRYACHKLELTLTPEGLDPLKRGYFYEIEP